MLILGVTMWPQHHRPKYILLLWLLVTLIIDFGKHKSDFKTSHMLLNFNDFSLLWVLGGKFDSSNKATIH